MKASNLPTSAANSRIVGIAAPNQRNVMQAPPLQLSARNAPSWTANSNPGQQQQLTLDQWQHGRVPLASPEIASNGPLLSASSTSSSTVSSSQQQSQQLQAQPLIANSSFPPRTVGGSSRFYAPVSDFSSTNGNYEIVRSSVAGAFPASSGRYNIPDNNQNNGESSSRRQTFHASSGAQFPASSNSVVFSAQRDRMPISSSHQQRAQIESQEITVANEDVAEEDNNTLDVSATDNLAITNQMASKSSQQLSPLELVEQLNRILTVGDISGFPTTNSTQQLQEPTSAVHPLRSTSKQNRRAAFLLDGEADSSDSVASSHTASPRDLAARRLRSVSMPLVQIGSSKSQFDHEFPCGDRLPRYLKMLHHFDIQSVRFNLDNAIAVLEQVTRSTKTPACVNTTTGASAATLGSVRLYDDLSSCSAGAVNQNHAASSSNVTQVAPEMRDQGDQRYNAVLESCPYFRNEISTEEVRSVHLGRATVAKQLQRFIPSQQSIFSSQCDSTQSVTHPICNGISILDRPQIHGNSDLKGFGGFKAISNFVIEHHDAGALFYRDCFHGKEHRNVMANHPVYGPIVISLLRERVYGHQRANPLFQHKIIVRTADMTVLRGTVAEESIPFVHTGSHKKKSAANQQGPTTSEILSFILPGLSSINSFRFEDDRSVVENDMLRIDEQNMRFKYKFGVIFCRPGQSTEEEFYNNPAGSELFEDFLTTLGRRITLRNFSGFAGGLDTKQDTTGTESVYSSFSGFEVMFHVSTLLPFSPTNRQQLLRKRHIGNDVVTIIFQEPGSQPFTPRAIRSQYQHVFIIVRPVLAPGSNHTIAYQVAVSRAKDTPYFGPLLPPDGIFTNCREFGDFLLAKAINAENAVLKSGKFVAMALRTRRELLLDLVNSHSSSEGVVAGENEAASQNSANSTGFAASRLMRLSFRRVFRDKTSFLRGDSNSTKNLAQSQPSLTSTSNRSMSCQGGYAWNVVLVDCGQGGKLVQSTVVVSTDDLILVDREISSLPAIFCVPLKSLLGFRVQHSDLRIFYHKGESILLRSVDGAEDEIEEIVQRISQVAGIVEYVQAIHSVNEISLLSPAGLGRFGFLCSAQGVVLRVDDGGPAAACGLRPGCRIIEVFGIGLRALTGAQLRELFQGAQSLRLSILPALPSGAPRQSRVAPDTPTMYWLPQYFHSMSPDFTSNCSPKLKVNANGSAQNRIYAEIPLSKSNESLLVEENLNQPRRTLLLPATEINNSSSKTSNYQLHRWPMNATPRNSEASDNSGSNNSGSVALLEAQLAVERSRRLAAEHELAEAKSQLTEMRLVVKQFSDYFLSAPSSSDAAQRQKVRQWISTSVDNDENDGPFLGLKTERAAAV